MEQISAFTTHLNVSYDFVRKHMLQQIKPQQQQQSLYKRRQQDHQRKSSHANAVNNVDISNRRLGRNDKQSNTSDVGENNSVWKSRNHVRFFRDRKSLVRERRFITFIKFPSNHIKSLDVSFVIVVQHFITTHNITLHYTTLHSYSLSRLKVLEKAVLVALDVGFILLPYLGFFGIATYNVILMLRFVSKKIFLN